MCFIRLNECIFFTNNSVLIRSTIVPYFCKSNYGDASLAMDHSHHRLLLLFLSKGRKKNANIHFNYVWGIINIWNDANGMMMRWINEWIFSILPKYVSWFGIYSCISDNNFAISWESLVMLHNSSWLKSGVICLHNSIWLITFPKLDGPARLSENYNSKHIFPIIIWTFKCCFCWWWENNDEKLAINFGFMENTIQWIGTVFVYFCWISSLIINTNNDKIAFSQHFLRIWSIFIDERYHTNMVCECE